MVTLHSILLGSAVIHWMLTAVMALFARHKVQFLSIAWIFGIFSFTITCIIPFADFIESKRAAMLHPGPLFALMAALFLQSIYPLGIVMPGYLQWKRMWNYALPAISVGLLYVLLTLLGMTSPNYYTWGELFANIFTFDLLLRFAMLGVGVYYVVNIFRLPRKMLRYPQVPRYLHAYAFHLGLISCLYLWLNIKFTVLEFELWLVLFALANFYMCMRTLETIALTMPQPEIKVIEDIPEQQVEAAPDENDDFNEANFQRFQRTEFWMQHHAEAWKENTFGRDQLCEATGFNRHLLLQCVRSQGYNNIHDYINVYRVNELKRMITAGESKNLTECLDAGFGTIKTARACFQKATGETLDDYLSKILPA